MVKFISFILIFFISLVSCQNKISEEDLIAEYNKYKSTVSIILSEEGEKYLENTKENNLIDVFRKSLQNYLTLGKKKYNYIINNIDSKKIKTLIKNAYSLNKNTETYQNNENNFQNLEYIYNILKLIDEREKSVDKTIKITSKDENYLKHPYTFYETIYLNPIYKFFDVIEKNSIIIDDKIILIEGKLYEHSNPFKLFSKKNDILIVKALTCSTENNEQNIEIYKIIFNISIN